MDDLYQEVPLPLSGLREWIAQAAVSGIFTLGQGILHIRSQDNEIEVKLCDEADVHVIIDNAELAQEIVAEWTARGLTSYKVGQTK